MLCIPDTQELPLVADAGQPRWNHQQTQLPPPFPLLELLSITNNLVCLLVDVGNAPKVSTQFVNCTLCHEHVSILTFSSSGGIFSVVQVMRTLWLRTDL